MLYSVHNGLEHFDIIKGRELYNKPIYKAANIHSILELNQLAMYGPNSPYYLHADPISIENESLALKIANMKKDIMNSFRGDSISILDTPETLPLPPSSVQTFLKHKIDVPALVLSNHNGEYQNKFYNSFWDNSKQVGYTSNPKNFVSKMTTLVSYLSNSVLKIIQSQQEQQLQADADLVRTISECFFVNISCDFFTYIRGHESTVATAHQTFYPLYISVAYPSITSAHFEFVRVIERLLAFVTGEPIPNVRTKEECEKLQGTYDYVTFEWYDQLNGTRTWDSVCKRTTRFTTKAMSPVFERKDEPDWNLNYSTWTESVWTVPTARIFIAPTRYQEYSTLAAGLGVLIVSITIITFLNRNSDLIFLGLRRAGTESSASC